MKKKHTSYVRAAIAAALLSPLAIRAAGPTGLCGVPAPGAYLDRCGYESRLPLLLVSPFARQNFVDSTLSDQTSILRFIEDNWNLGRLGNQSFDALAGSLNFEGPVAPPVMLDPATGLVVTQ